MVVLKVVCGGLARASWQGGFVSGGCCDSGNIALLLLVAVTLGAAFHYYACRT
jgi:hypothetical protein